MRWRPVRHSCWQCPSSSGHPPVLTKEREVNFRNTNYKYVGLAECANPIAAGMSPHGLSHAWYPEQKDGMIGVRCVITHVLGHSEETVLYAEPDNSQDTKNNIQRVGSTVTYLERYTLLALTGLAAGDMDDDGRSAGGGAQRSRHIPLISSQDDNGGNGMTLRPW